MHLGCKEVRACKRGGAVSAGGRSANLGSMDTLQYPSRAFNRTYAIRLFEVNLLDIRVGLCSNVLETCTRATFGTSNIILGWQTAFIRW